MPKDKIEDAAQTDWHVEVSWRRRPDGDDRGTAEGHVQLATVNLHSPFEFPDVETEGHFEAGEWFDGWRVTLDEAGIDRLIKSLHRAKRQAFGPPMLDIRVADPDEHFMRDVSTIADYPQLRCVRPEHEGQPCSVTGEQEPPRVLRFAEGRPVSAGQPFAHDDCLLWSAEGDLNEGRGVCVLDTHAGRPCRTEGVSYHRDPTTTHAAGGTDARAYASGGVIRPQADSSGDAIPVILSEGGGPYSHDPYTGRPAPATPSYGYHLQPEADAQSDPESTT